MTGEGFALLAPFAMTLGALELLSVKKLPTLSNIAFVQGDSPCDKVRAGGSVEGTHATGANLLLEVSCIQASQQGRPYYLVRFDEPFKSCNMLSTACLPSLVRRPWARASSSSCRRSVGGRTSEVLSAGESDSSLGFGISSIMY